MSPDDLQTVLQHYQDRLIQQYRALPNARATIAILCKQALMDGLPIDVLHAFDLGTAVGEQLDTIGKYVGLSRNIGTPSAKPYHGYWDSTQGNPLLQNALGLMDATDLAQNATGIFFDARDIARPKVALNDAAYSFMLRLKIVLNHCDHSFVGIVEALYAFFGSSMLVVDVGTNIIYYTVTGNLPVPLSMLQAYLPRPMGVDISVEVDTSLPSWKINPIPA